MTDEPDQQNEGHGNRCQQAFVGSAVREQHETHGEREGCGTARRLFQTGECPEEQGTTEQSDLASPVGESPAGEKRGIQRGEKAAIHGPASWDPAAEHPEDGSTGGGHAEPGTSNRIAGRGLSQCEQQSLCGWIFRLVRRLVNDMEAFEVFPLGMRGVGQFAGCEGICSEQVSELVVDHGGGNADTETDAEFQQQRQAEEEQDTPGYTVRKAAHEPAERFQNRDRRVRAADGNCDGAADNDQW